MHSQLSDRVVVRATLSAFTFTKKHMMSFYA